MNSITALSDLKYLTPFIYLHDTSGFIQATPPEQTPLFFPTISSNSCQQKTEFFQGLACTNMDRVYIHN